MVIAIIIGLGTSFLGSMCAFVLWVHYDLDGLWKENRIRHGRKLDEKARAKYAAKYDFDYEDKP